MPDVKKQILNHHSFKRNQWWFNISVLNACCEKADIEPPLIPFKCTVALARKKWKLHPTKLPDVCRYLDIPLNHHEALSDAMACAKIVIAAADNVV